MELRISQLERQDADHSTTIQSLQANLSDARSLMDLKDRAITSLIEKSDALVAAVGAEADEKEEPSNNHSLATSLAKSFKAKMDTVRNVARFWLR